MKIFLYVLLLIVGLGLIIKGGDWFVNASVWIAKKMRIPEIIIGATIVSIGTTLPEILTSLTSAIKAVSQPEASSGLNALAVGNAVGSMLCNIGLILAIVLVIRPPKVDYSEFLQKAIPLMGASVMLGIFAITGAQIVLWEGIVLLAVFVLFMGQNIYSAIKQNEKLLLKPIHEQTEQEKKQEVDLKSQNKYKMTAMFIVGAAAIAGGAYSLVESAQFLCISFGIPQQIVAITVLALGTSLPELVTSIVALKKGNSDIGLGNILGANMINGTLLIGLISVVSGKGMPIDAITANVAVWIMLGITLILCVPTIITKKTSKWQGCLMLATYLGFLTFNIIKTAI